MSADVALDSRHARTRRDLPEDNLSNSVTQSSETISPSVPFLATQRYALPIHYSSAGAADRYSDLFCDNNGDQTPRAENALRRKTPNGTLKAGYLSTTEDSNPLKHQLMPLSEGDAVQYTTSAVPVVKRTFLQHQQQRAQNASLNAYTRVQGQPWLLSQYQQSHSIFPVDSLLQQMPMHPYNQQQIYAQTIPSVLQPSVQYLGPTASGIQDSGSFGPYWPDGTFVPYRPAAIRDPRFYHHNYSQYQLHPSSRLSGSSQHNPRQAVSCQGEVISTEWSQFRTVQQPINTANPSHGPFSSNTLTQHDHRHFRDSDVQRIHAHKDAALWMQHTGHGRDNSFAALTEDFGPDSSNARQRDRTFEWALQQYRELLAFIHTTRRQQHGRPMPGQSPGHRPTFFPKPPKPQASASVPPPKRRLSGDSIERARVRTRPAIQRADTAPVTGEEDSHDEGHDLAIKPRSTSLWQRAGPQAQETDQYRRASHDQYRRPQVPGAWSHQDYATVPGSMHYPRERATPFLITPEPLMNSPQSRAQFALHIVSKYCEQTDWQWVDGIHLGGCLSYGLGDYHKALWFYDKVLELEPRHLEATSNLAATLLAIGRKQDAEHNWLKVVKAAPNHFEAVEHLIGLFCNDHRTRDAVRVIEYVETCLRHPKTHDTHATVDRLSECSSTASKSPAVSVSGQSDKILHDFDVEGDSFNPDWRDYPGANEPGFGSSGFAVPGSDNGRMLALVHAKGNMLYGTGDNVGAARAFEDAVLVAVGRKFDGVRGLVKYILDVVTANINATAPAQQHANSNASNEPILLAPEQALDTAKQCFPRLGQLPGLQYLPGSTQSLARKAVISTTSNSLLSLAKIFQDSMSNSSRSPGISPLPSGVRDILALYYLSLSLQPSPSTANNVGILLASVQQRYPPSPSRLPPVIPGVLPGSGISLALQYYNYGLQLDAHHAHLYTNLGSLLKDIGQLDAAIDMYERAVKCDAKFDIALANLANAVKDKGRINDAIVYYKRAVEVNPDFAEAVCGLANALNSVCSWQARGGIASKDGQRDPWHVDPMGMLLDARQSGTVSSGWIKRVVDIVEKQLADGEDWGRGTLSPAVQDALMQQLGLALAPSTQSPAAEQQPSMRELLASWAGRKWEGARVVRLIERASRRVGWQWYQDLHITKKDRHTSAYRRPQLPSSLATPAAPTVLPFHTFTCPMSAKQVRLISQRNALRISVSTLRAPWLPQRVYMPPSPPTPYLRVGYISSDFNNHPLAHLMQSVFGLHDKSRVKAHCYATTASDNSIHRQQIQNEAPVFCDASGWSTEKLVAQIVRDEIHILINLNGYTRGARNEVFAARPAPVQMSFMGFAGTLGAEWCDYLLADEIATPPDTLRGWRRNVDLADQAVDGNYGGDENEWVYSENIIYCRDTFFCCDHKQSAPDANDTRITWEEEQARRRRMRREMFPHMPSNAVILANFNQLYKIEPTTFRTWLRILARVPNAFLWLLRFPDLGEAQLLATARLWAGADVAARIIFTDVAPKQQHIARARVCDLVLDTAECNAHTTAADVLWSGTPLLTLPRHRHKMCSRMAASILTGALPRNAEGVRAGEDLIASGETDYENKAVTLASEPGLARLLGLRRLLWSSRWSSALFDTRRWVRDLEDAYDEAWRRWVLSEGGDIWLDRLPRGRDERTWMTVSGRVPER